MLLDLWLASALLETSVGVVSCSSLSTCDPLYGAFMVARHPTEVMALGQLGRCMDLYATALETGDCLVSTP